MPYLIDPPEGVSPYSEPSVIRDWIDELRAMPDPSDSFITAAISEAEIWISEAKVAEN